jgi:methanogenic corrinoid protein MtbC1
MQKYFLSVAILLSIITTAFSQNKLFTKAGVVSFNSKTAVEKIQAINKKALAVLDIVNNKIEFAVLIKGFEFEKALMQEHFNENYLESDKYPKATFKGKFEVEKFVITATEGKPQIVNVTGTLTMHGITKTITTVATITSKNKVLSATATFTILLSDFNIKIPAINKNNVNNQVQISINLANLQEMK